MKFYRSLKMIDTGLVRDKGTGRFTTKRNVVSLIHSVWEKKNADGRERCANRSLMEIILWTPLTCISLRIVVASSLHVSSEIVRNGHFLKKQQSRI